MEKYDYKEILMDAGIVVNESQNNTWRTLLRQCMICSGVWIMYFIKGLGLGLPTVLIEQTRNEANSTEAVTVEMTSWLSSLTFIAAAPTVFILPWFYNQLGRKITYSLLCILTIVSFIVLYYSANLYHVLISLVLLGPMTAAFNTFMPIMIVEYTTPKYRGIFLTLKSASTFWGIWVANAIGTFFHWKNIATLGLVCSAYLLTVIAWPESPYYLAKKGRYAESVKSHRWLKGADENSEKELAKLIGSQKKSETINVSSNSNKFQFFREFSKALSIIKLRSFYKPALICLAIFAQYHFSGKLVISIYAIQVLKIFTQDKAFAYKLMLILDGVTVFSMYIGCILSRYCKRRTLMLLFTITGILFLYMMSLYLYLVSLCILQENHIVILFLLTGFSIAIGCGPIILITSIYGEIVPLRFQNPIMMLCGFFTLTTGSILLKILPFMISILTLPECFLFFAIPSTIIITILYYYLPETKGKTVHEIEEYFTGDQKSIELSTVLFNKT